MLVTQCGNPPALELRARNTLTALNLRGLQVLWFRGLVGFRGSGFGGVGSAG